MASITGKSYRLKRFFRQDYHYGAVSIETKEKKKAKIYFDDRELYSIACDAHILGADIIIEYDMIVSERPFTVICKAVEIARE